jgi:predicted nucleic acid-binding protein
MVGCFSSTGSKGSTAELSELQKALRLLRRLTAVLPVTEDVATTYGFLQSELMRRGKRRLAVNDGWIAATASDHELTLVTGDARFNDLDFALRIEDWRA